MLPLFNPNEPQGPPTTVLMIFLPLQDDQNGNLAEVAAAQGESTAAERQEGPNAEGVAATQVEEKTPRDARLPSCRRQSLHRQHSYTQIATLWSAVVRAAAAPFIARSRT